MPIMLCLGFRSRKQLKMFKQFKVQKAERALEIFLTALTKQPSCQFPNEAITAARRFCIIREIENYVASMLRAQKINGSPHGPQRIADPQNVEGNLLIASVQNVQTVQVVKNEGLGSEIFEHPATRLDSRRCENLIVPREIEG
jgi:hypothetical protein